MGLTTLQKNRKKGKRLQQIHEELGLSQRKFALSIGLAEGSLAGIISGRNSITQVLANSIELTYRYSAKWILKGILPKKIEESRAANSRDRLMLELVDLLSPSKIIHLLEEGLWSSLNKLTFEKRLSYLSKGGSSLLILGRKTFAADTQASYLSKMMNSAKENLKPEHYLLYLYYICQRGLDTPEDKNLFLSIDSRTVGNIKEYINPSIKSLKAIKETWK